MLALSRLSRSPLSCALLQGRALFSSEPQETGTLQYTLDQQEHVSKPSRVCFTDPSLLWSPQEAAGAANHELAKTHFFATIPCSVANKLHEAKFTLGDGDTPEGSWVVGKQGELFEYHLVGVHKVRSGFTATLRCPAGSSSALPAIPESEHAAIKGMMKQAATTQALAGGSVLFLGGLVDCETAAVYLHKQGTSVLITSNHEGF